MIVVVVMVLVFLKCQVGNLPNLPKIPIDIGIPDCSIPRKSNRSRLQSLNLA